MARSIIRYSLNGSGASPRTAITKVLSRWVSRRTARCWEAPDVNLNVAMATMMLAMQELSMSGRLHHVWIYVDKVRRQTDPTTRDVRPIHTAVH